AALQLQVRPGLQRPEQDNGVDLYLRDDATDVELEHWNTLFTQEPVRLTGEQKRKWLEEFDAGVLGSDGYIPFRDSIDRAFHSGVRWVVQPGGSSRDSQVIAACDDYGIAM